MKTKNTWINLWGQPLLIAVLSITGLVSALVGDGVFDIIAWLCLLYPIISICYHYWRKPAAAIETRSSGGQPTIDELAYTNKEGQDQLN